MFHLTTRVRYELATNLPREIPCRPNVLTLNCGPPEGGLRRAARRLRRILLCLCKWRDAVQIRDAAAGSAGGKRGGGPSISTPSWAANDCVAPCATHANV